MNKKLCPISSIFSAIYINTEIPTIYAGIPTINTGSQGSIHEYHVKGFDSSEG